MFKKIILPLFVLSVAAAFSQTAYSASSKEDIQRDFTVYSSEIEKKTANLLASMEKDMETLDGIITKDGKKDISDLEKSVDSKTKELISQMDAAYSKLKTPEVKRYHKISLKFIKIRYNITKDVLSAYKAKKGVFQESDFAAVVNKYKNELESLQKENAEALQAIGNIVADEAGKPK
ncbi:MAG: hypothetical protein K2N67_05430 [Mucispirillum sp.]|nr:hypothetical protein [Mucispirillum sp.]